MKLAAIIALALIVVFLASCSSPTGKVIIIGPNQVPCEQGSNSACYLVKDSESSPWTVVNSTIERLQPEDGYQYTVLVHESGKTQADPYSVPTVTFKVLDVIQKEEVMGRIKWYYG